MSSARPPHPRHGLTLVEIVIVLAILAVLVTVFLPQVHRDRYAARRTQCKNNLKQMGLALQNYHETYQSFPAGYDLPSEGTYTGWGWTTSLLPFMDQQSLYEQIHFSGGISHEYNKPDIYRLPPQFRCPTDPGTTLVAHLGVVTSDVRDGIVVPATVDAAEILSRSTYFGVVGYLPAELGGIDREHTGDSQINPGRLGNLGSSFSSEGRYCDPHSFRGAFGQNSHVKIADIKDGTSNVLIVGERATPKVDALGTIGHGTWLGVPDCSTSAGLAAGLGDTSVKLNHDKWPILKGSTGFSSFHEGGAQFLLADGSVRFLNEKISIATYRDLSTIDDGRQVGEY